MLIPCFNPNEWIFEAIESVINQTHDNWSLYVINDGSPDIYNFFNLSKSKYKDQRITFLSLGKNFGQSAVRNIALLIGDGDILTFLDQDDKRDKNMFAKFVEVFQANKQLSLLFCNTNAITSESSILDNYYSNENEVRNNLNCDVDSEKLSYRFLLNQPIRMGSFMILREAFAKIRGFNVSTDGSEEIDFFQRVVSEYKIGKISEKYYYRRVHENSQVRVTYFRRQVGRLNYLRKFFLKENKYNNLIKKKYYNLSINLIISSFLKGNISESKFLLYRLRRDNFLDPKLFLVTLMLNLNFSIIRTFVKQGKTSLNIVMDNRQ